MSSHLDLEKKVKQSLKNYVSSEKPSANLKSKILEVNQRQSQRYVPINYSFKKILFVATLLITLLAGGTIYAAPYLGQFSVNKLFEINQIPIFSENIKSDNNSNIDHDLSISVDKRMKILSENTKISKIEIQKKSPVQLNLPTSLPRGYKLASDFGRDGVITWDVKTNSVSHIKNGEIEYTAYFEYENKDSHSTGINDDITLTYRYDPNFIYSNAVGISDVIGTETIKGFQVVETINSLDAWIPMEKTGVLHIILSTNSNSIMKNESVDMLTSVINQLTLK